MTVKGSVAQRDEQEVRDTVAAIVSAFGDGRMDDYFSCFHPECSFVFHTTENRLNSVAEYRALWDGWVAEDGFEVRSCRTGDTHIQVWGDAAVVTHSVETRGRTRSSEEVLLERETIVLARQADGRWLAVHEHLSPAEW
jgi:ketosteroid isomerase-like protein